MIYFWNQVVHPILQLTRPKVIVEIGCAQGYNTVNLLEYVKPMENGQLVAIDPSPLFDIERMKQIYVHKFLLVQDYSLKVLPHIHTCDAAFIDGDHNWYTVYNELKQFERIKKFPIIFLHDLEWPYGRRDMYYFPESIPAEFRKPSAKKGILPGINELVDNGHNDSVHNAAYENGDRNGVLTAVEDFMMEAQIPLQLHRVRSQFGLGIIMPDITETDHYFNREIRRIIEQSGL